MNTLNPSAWRWAASASKAYAFVVSGRADVVLAFHIDGPSQTTHAGLIAARATTGRAGVLALFVANEVSGNSRVLAPAEGREALDKHFAAGN